MRFLTKNLFMFAAKQDIIVLKEVEEEVLKYVFRYLYSGHTQILINQEALALQALKLADRWLVSDLVRWSKKKNIFLIT